ncbi:MAG TPA: NIPSNAP family protein [Gaiellaceae bacterium]|nr:NIPSNAP family protein [Gaiellaceae bacterium]
MSRARLNTIGDVIVEQRDYHVHTGKLPEVLRLYEAEGIPLQQRYLGGFIGAFTTDVGALSTYTSLWGYESYAERERRRAELQADDEWKDFLARLQPLLHTQKNRILIPTSFSPLQ